MKGAQLIIIIFSYFSTKSMQVSVGARNTFYTSATIFSNIHIQYVVASFEY